MEKNNDWLGHTYNSNSITGYNDSSWWTNTINRFGFIYN